MNWKLIIGLGFTWLGLFLLLISAGAFIFNKGIFGILRYAAMIIGAIILFIGTIIVGRSKAEVYG